MQALLFAVWKFFTALPIAAKLRNSNVALSFVDVKQTPNDQSETLASLFRRIEV
jgi:hypothetical protein